MEQFVCQAVSQSYQQIPTIENVSLSLAQGELVSLVGTSGVGKTTLFHILAGVELPDSGRVLLEGEDITGQPGRVSYMLQKDLLLPFKTVEENISLALILGGGQKAQVVEQVRALLPDFGLENYGQAFPHQLSGGMRQRAALARTFLRNCPVMLLDEPFSALDVHTKAEMHRWYLALVHRTACTTLFITHDIDEALLLSHRIYVMGGRPGTIVGEIAPVSPWPRSPQYLLTPEFLEDKRRILQLMTPLE